MLVFAGFEGEGYPEKTSLCRVENQQIQPTYGAESGNQTRAKMVGGECPHQYTILAPYNVSNTCDCLVLFSFCGISSSQILRGKP